MPYVKCDLELSIREQGVLSGITYLGIVFSSHFWGFLADTYGRKKVLRLAAAAAFIVSFSSAFAVNTISMILLRFLAGAWLVLRNCFDDETARLFSLFNIRRIVLRALHPQDTLISVNFIPPKLHREPRLLSVLVCTVFGHFYHHLQCSSFQWIGTILCISLNSSRGASF